MPQTEAPEAAQASRKTLTGLSFSGCVTDIAAGRVPLTAVGRILANTSAHSPEQWDHVIETAKKGEWSTYPNAETIARQLLAEGRVEQPGLHNKNYKIASGGRYWRDPNTGEDFRPKDSHEVMQRLGITQDSGGRNQ